MSDDYEYEVMRAELLGLPPPERKDVKSVSKIEDDEVAKDEFFHPVKFFFSPTLRLCSKEKSTNAQERMLLDIEIQDEQLGSVSAGLDELTSILSVTQKRINRFKTVCGSFTNLLKLKVGAGKNDGTSSECSSAESEGDEAVPPEDVPSNSNTENTGREEMNGAEVGEMVKTTTARNLELEGKLTSKDLDLEGKLTRGIDKLDSILMKADQAEISMSKQNKEMRSFLN